MTITGQEKALPKSNLTHPWPKLYGSAIGRPRRTEPGQPIETASYAQSAASCFTPETISLGVSFGPDGRFRCILCPLARILTEVPPMSTTSTFLTRDFLASAARSRRAAPRTLVRGDLASTAATRALEDRGLAHHTPPALPAAARAPEVATRPRHRKAK